MGVLASGSVHTRPSARPTIDTSGNFSAHVSDVISKISKLYDKSFQEKFEISKFFGQIGLIGGVGDVLNSSSQLKIFLYMLLGSQCKKLEPYDKPF